MKKLVVLVLLGAMLICTACGKKDWCIETAASELQE